MAVIRELGELFDQDVVNVNEATARYDLYTIEELEDEYRDRALDQLDSEGVIDRDNLPSDFYLECTLMVPVDADDMPPIVEIQINEDFTNTGYGVLLWLDLDQDEIDDLTDWCRDNRLA